MDQEIQHIKKMLMNNFPNRILDENIKKFTNKKKNENEHKNKINVLYKNQMHGNYKIEERVIKNIVRNNIKCQNNQEQLNIVFYYKNMKSSNLVIKNSPSRENDSLSESNVIYKFSCHVMPCKADYIGLTRTKLKKRLDLHYYNGSILKHYKEHHHKNLTKEDLYKNTIIIEKDKDSKKLFIKESLKILELSPKINIQFDSFSATLSLYKRPSQQIGRPPSIQTQD